MQLHTRLTEFLLLLVCFSCPFIVQHKLSNKRSLGRTFVFSPSSEFDCGFVVVCAFALFLSCLLLSVYLNMFDVCICNVYQTILHCFYLRNNINKPPSTGQKYKFFPKVLCFINSLPFFTCVHLETV